MIDEIKQVIVIRKIFEDENGNLKKVRKGKLISQGAHASGKIFFDMMNISTVPDDNNMRKAVLMINDDIYQWLTGLFTKIVVSVDSEKELIDIYNKAKENKIPCCYIVDSGKTEFNNKPTYTAVAIGPAKSSIIDPITKSLPLL